MGVPEQKQVVCMFEHLLNMSSLPLASEAAQQADLFNTQEDVWLETSPFRSKERAKGIKAMAATQTMEG